MLINVKFSDFTLLVKNFHFATDCICNIEIFIADMNFKTSYFITHPTGFQILLYTGILTWLWFAEAYILLPPVKSKWQHTISNLKFVFTALPVQLFMTIFLVMISSWVAIHHWGILIHLPFSNSFFVKYFIGFILLDFFDYVYHIIMHKVKPLWKFHLVHHTDQTMDVSTTIREHPGETFFRMCFLIIWVFLSGASFGLLLLRQTFQTIANITSHTQFRLSEKNAKRIGAIFVTPNLHHVHHHFKLPYTDCNYGDVLSIWDRLFGTYNELESSKTVFGIDTHMNKSICKSFTHTFKIPFKKTKDLNNK
ncbi:MAG: Sterol desaturase/sphingolipid hydroxylase, fatty acid hydroxylase superfamily [Mucilaginibacter sp.]|nr:Sterol desaturase/sphingolipid hydroxylase, fatty acid hydroxylase superfamily [Mucilaginibacter sp.]